MRRTRSLGVPYEVVTGVSLLDAALAAIGGVSCAENVTVGA
jgi:precorrin-4 methylase